ncbi:tyrosine-type recombinase/integrase [Deinococcus humi]|uniref:Integrase/recombinase XerC n=1 Tax=Deinococcus humi TaxID=662880 RepID=A0A7W8JZL6_9DEIO|nr:site-specific integrase [Deinococcus humi]MBB5366157.1 integrase/recombinase XerC [Deinococcus humi]
MTLDLYRGGLQDRSRTWTALHPDERKRRAKEAAALKDPEGLWTLTEAHLTQHAASGVLTSKHTLTSYRAGLRAFLKHADHRAWNILRPSWEDAQDWVGDMLATGRSIATVRVRVAAAAALYKALRWADATEAHPFETVVIPKDRRHGLEKNAPYTEAQVNSALRAAELHPTRSAELHALLLVLAHGGLRIDEALNLKWSDVQLVPPMPGLTVRLGKGRKSRGVPLSPRLRAALMAYRALPRTARHREEFIFPYRTWRGAARHVQPLFADIDGGVFRGFHALRKAMGSRLYAQLGDFAAVAEVLGHADINTTRGYVRIGEERARTAMDSW